MHWGVVYLHEREAVAKGHWPLQIGPCSRVWKPSANYPDTAGWCENITQPHTHLKFLKHNFVLYLQKLHSSYFIKHVSAH